MKKPARPSIQFPTYAKESSATAVDETPWFARSAPERSASPPPLPPHVQAPLPQRTATMAPKPAPRVSAPIPPPPADIARLAPIAPIAPTLTSPAPAWNLPAFPVAAAPHPERKELPSFGPVAFDLDERNVETVVKPRPRRTLLSWLAATLAVIVGIVAGRELVDRDASSNAASELGTASTPSPSLPVAKGPAAGGHRITPEELFPAAPATPPKLTRVPAAQYAREKARLAADLAQRNAPVLAPSFELRSPSHRPAAPTLDDMIRAPRLRGERD